ncbi:MAG TPA: pyridoxamine 5'-phosphate oxidase family protein [Rubrivivax sp.]|nr:pyridoxamine 5'-phosphate oxidase family protein [Rubrivivax sp.]HPO19909.1 pyridoxamine 5'-phosphate oxidase family protein [Rubrivivax sp.]
MDVPPPSPIGPQQAELIGRRVSIIVGSRDAALRPHLMRALACSLSADRRQVTVLINPHSAEQVVADLRANGHIAVVFSEPTTHRTLQLKGNDAQVLECGADGEALAERHLQRFIAELADIGLPAEVARTLLKREGSLVALRFTVREAYDQTPGPQAGSALHAPAGAA